MASAVGIAASIVTAGGASGLAVAVVAGAVGGAAGALTGALLNGANIGQIAKSTFTGAFWGAVGGLANFASADTDLIAQLFKHSFTEGIQEGLQGGNIAHGMMMGAVSSAGGSLITKYESSLKTAGCVTANAVLSGTVSEIGGGKFANGAVTGAFSVLFNDMMHSYLTYKNIRDIYNAYLDTSWSPGEEGLYKKPTYRICKEIGGQIGAMAGEVENSCAIRLSYALNEAGLKIPYIPNITYKGSNGDNYFIKASAVASYLNKYRRIRVNNTRKVINGIAFIHNDGFFNDSRVTGHVDIVYNGKWGGSATVPYSNKNGKIDVFY